MKNGKLSEKKCNISKFPKLVTFDTSGFHFAFALRAEKSGLPWVTWTERRPWWSLSSCSTNAVPSLHLTSPRIKLKKTSRRGKGELPDVPHMCAQGLALFGATNRKHVLSEFPAVQKITFCFASGKKKRSVSGKRRRSGSGRDRRRRGGGWRRRRG